MNSDLNSLVPLVANGMERKSAAQTEIVWAAFFGGAAPGAILTPLCAASTFPSAAFLDAGFRFVELSNGDSVFLHRRESLKIQEEAAGEETPSPGVTNGQPSPFARVALEP